MVKNVEVEGGELALQNSNGDIAIIPKRYRREVEDMIKDGCYDCIDDFVSKLPSTTDYAEAGALFSNPTQPTQPVTQVNLPTFDVVADKNTKQDLPYYNQLTEQQKGLMEQDNPIGRSIRHEAREGQQFSADDAKDYLKGMALGGLSDISQTLQIPQSAMVEGIEALRGNEYDMSNALPNYGSYDSNQRVPSETFGKDLKPVDKFALDLLADPTNIVGAGLVRGAMQKGAKAVSKKIVSSVDDVGKGITQSSNKIDQTIINDYTNREIAWLNSDEYIKRNMAATGKTREAVMQETDEIVKQLDKTKLNVLDEKADMAAGVYVQDKNNPLINLFDTGDKKLLLNVADHEIKHAASQQALRSTDGLIDLVTSPYKKYPTTNVKKWYDDLIPGESLSKWASNAPEQQVVSRRIMDLVEETQGVKRGTQLTDDNIKGVIDLLNKDIKAQNFADSDIIGMMRSFKSKFGKDYYKQIKEMVNNAYLVPAAIGTGAAVNQNNKEQ